MRQIRRGKLDFAKGKENRETSGRNIDTALLQGRYRRHLCTRMYVPCHAVKLHAEVIGRHTEEIAFLCVEEWLFAHCGIPLSSTDQMEDCRHREAFKTRLSMCVNKCCCCNSELVVDKLF